MSDPKLGIAHIESLLESVTEVFGDAISLVKNGISLSAFSNLMHLLAAVKQIIADAPGAIPELHDLDDAESAALGAKAYEAIKKMIMEVQK